MPKKAEPSTLATNRKARHIYHVQESLEVGIELRGTEVKSMKAREFAFSDAHARIEANQMVLIGLHISPYKQGNQFNHDPDRTRRLLAHGEEIRRLHKRVTEKGLTLVPLRFYLKRGLVKLEVGLCKGKQLQDKRQDIKKRDQARDAQREMSLQRRNS